MEKCGNMQEVEHDIVAGSRTGSASGTMHCKVLYEDVKN